MSSPSPPIAPNATPNSGNASPIASSSPRTIVSPPPQVMFKLKSTSQSEDSSAPVRPLSDIIGDKFPPFDHEVNIVSPFNNELGRDTAFEKELGELLLDAILEIHAWAASRPKHESSIAAQNIERKIVSVMDTESEQGMSLLRPQHFRALLASIVEIIKQLPNRLQELAGKRVVIDGTLITQRLHYAPAPHPYRHVQGWFRLARELQEAGVSAVCVFDGKQRNIAKAREAERRKDLQRKAEARGALEIDRSKRLKQLSDVLPRFWGLNDALQKRTTDILRQLVPDLPPKRANRETLEDLPLRRQDILHVAPITPEILKPRLSMDVDFFIPEIVADEGIADDGLFVANHVDSLLQEVDATYVEDFADHPWFQEPTTPFYWEPFTLEPNEPDMYTNLDRDSFVDFALLLGTDFSQRIKNVGPTRALKFIREHGSIERVVELETKYVPPLAPQAYLAQVELARSVFRTLPPVPDAELLKQGDIDETTLVAVLQKYGLGKEVVDVVDWDYGAALRGNYFQDNPSAF
ncbi:hypothetical protein H0H93_000757 [Arthromyces matolae]|nr:hypothetical protein H0H93_000757 [Arthromyces matolae]